MWLKKYFSFFTKMVFILWWDKSHLKQVDYSRSVLIRHTIYLFYSLSLFSDTEFTLTHNHRRRLFFNFWLAGSRKRFKMREKKVSVEYEVTQQWLSIFLHPSHMRFAKLWTGLKWGKLLGEIKLFFIYKFIYLRKI